jgi:Mrp family chromosome partitioning ATPase
LARIRGRLPAHAHTRRHFTEERVLDVLVAGAAFAAQPGEMIETDRRSTNMMEALVDQVKSAYDLVVIDAPSMCMCLSQPGGGVSSCA